MAKYRKKPLIIEAFLTLYVIEAVKYNWKALPECVSNAYESGNVIFLTNAIIINTLEGHLRADIDDMIICGVKGELYPCKPDIFAATYEPA